MDPDMLRLALEIAVDELTTDTKAPVVRDDGTTAYRPVPALLGQLEAARRANSGRGGAVRMTSKPPLWIDAVSLLDEIGGVVRGYDRPGLAGRVRAWSGEAHGTTDPGTLAAAVEQAEVWVRRARSLLEPRPARRLRGARCPMCGWASVVVTGHDGEEVLRPALEVDVRTGEARCVAEGCDARWKADELALLGEQIAAQTQHETLALED